MNEFCEECQHSKSICDSGDDSSCQCWDIPDTDLGEEDYSNEKDLWGDS